MLSGSMKGGNLKESLSVHSSQNNTGLTMTKVVSGFQSRPQRKNSKERVLPRSQALIDTQAFNWLRA